MFLIISQNSLGKSLEITISVELIWRFWSIIESLSISRWQKTVLLQRLYDIFSVISMDLQIHSSSLHWFFWSVFSRIRTEYVKILRISPYSVQMWENAARKTPNTDNFHPVLFLPILKINTYGNQKKTKKHMKLWKFNLTFLLSIGL